jgi:hypothetical protein
MKKISNFLLNLFLFLIIFDFTGDPIIRSYEISLEKFEFYYKTILTVLFLILFFFNFKFKNILKKIYAPYLLICVILFYGFFLGIINNNVYNALNELSGYIFILLTPIIVNIKGKRINESSDDRFVKYIKILTYVVFFKIVIYEFATLIFFGIPSYKILLKQTPLLLISFSILLEKILNKEKGFNLLFLLTCFILFVAIARMIYISMIFLFLIHFIKNFSFTNLKNQVKILLILFSSFILYINIQSLDYIGTLERLYGGDVYEEGVDYRMTQFFVILKRFYDFPFGAGFGYFTPNYLTYNELAKPYLLELDLLNFFSKIGILFSLLYIITIFYIYSFLQSTINPKNNRLFAYYTGIISLLIYSLGQTAHQGYLYWVTFSIFYSSLIIYSKSYKQYSYVVTIKQ